MSMKPSELPWYKRAGINLVVYVMWAVLALTILGVLFGATGPGDTGRW